MYLLQVKTPGFLHINIYHYIVNTTILHKITVNMKYYHFTAIAVNIYSQKSFLPRVYKTKMSFPSTTDLMNHDLTTTQKLFDFAYHLVALPPRNAQINWACAVADIGRSAQILSTGDFVNVYIDEGSRVGARILELSVLRDPNRGFIVYHLNITRSGRPLTRSDKQLFDAHGFDDIGGLMAPHIKYRMRKWNAMEMSDGGFMWNAPNRH